MLHNSNTWKVYYSSKTFEEIILPHLNNLLNGTEGSIQTWFEKNTEPARPNDHISKNLCNVGFMQCGHSNICIKLQKIREVSPLLHYLRRYPIIRRHLKTYRVHKKLFNTGLPVPEPYALLYHYEKKSKTAFVCFIFQKLENVIALRKYWRRNKENDKNSFPPLSYSPFTVLGEVIAKLHNIGYNQCDLHWGNIMVNEDKKVFLIDIDSIKRLPYFLTTTYINIHIAMFVYCHAKFQKQTNQTAERDLVAISLFLNRYCEIIGTDKIRLLTNIGRSLYVARIIRLFKTYKLIENHIDIRAQHALLHKLKHHHI